MGSNSDVSPAEGRRLRARRREVLRFLGGFGLTVPTAALVSAIDGALKSASAQAAAGQPVPRLGVYLPNWPDQVELWRQLSREWQAIGIELDLQQGTLDTFVSQIVAEQKLPHMGSMSWGGAPDRLDPDYFLSEMFHSRRTARGGLNFGFYRNEAFDKLADAQRSEMDPAKRQQLVREAQTHIVEDSPSIVLFHRDIIHAYNKRRFSGMKPILGNGIGFPYMPLSYMDITPLTPRKFIRLTSIYDIASLNPFLTPEIYNSTTLRLIYATFTTRDEKADVMPWALERWNIVNPTTVDITLRGNTKFHDGRPATAEDVKFTFDFINRHRFPALSRIYETVESAEITGDLTVRLKLRMPSAPFTANVLGYAFLAPKHIWERVPSNLATPADWPNDKPVGSGPWKFVEWRKAEYLQFAANPDFFMKPKLDGMVVLPVPQMESMVGMLERGDSDMLAWNLDMTLGARISRNPELEVVRTPTHGQHEVRLNLGMAPTNNKAFRRALQHVTDRKKLLDIIFSGAGVVSNGAPITPALDNWANPAISAPEVSVDRARAVLRDAGFTWNPQGRLVMPAA
ncbi:ABC transporter substrate-binding protein [Elioraea sp.]|uniref:ABC transporter substrate-binding protein n=1 Tax=Elioraea sp. TaxID=2185103 RepID=UPI0025BA9A8E|nr:ABC transporter substrate-binding protein [Elioraea sp.]